MASTFLSSTASPPKPNFYFHSSSFILPSFSHNILTTHSFTTKLFSSPKKATRLNAVRGEFPQELGHLLSSTGLDDKWFPLLLPLVTHGLDLVQTIEVLPESDRFWILSFVGLSWIYLTARPGVLVGAIDAYVLAPLQVVTDSILGRRNLKRTDFVLGDKIGEGTFGVVYYGAVVPKNSSSGDGDEEQEELRRRGRRVRNSEMDERLKNSQKVILKKVGR